MKVIIDNDVNDYKSIWMTDNLIQAIDQRKLPFVFEIFECRNIDDVCFAIKDMVVRGAPLIGVTAGYGLLQNAIAFNGKDFTKFKKDFEEKSKLLAQTRPTAVDLFNVINRISGILKEELSVKNNIENIRSEVNKIVQETLEECYALGQIGNDLIPKGKSNVMTICNAGALATIDYGTALAPFREANKSGKEITVYINETRPRIQGGRLTAWEMHNEGINHFILSDNAAGYYINKGKIDLVITGADRIVLNGDTANKIGTYTLSVLCKENIYYHYKKYYLNLHHVPITCQLIFMKEIG